MKHANICECFHYFHDKFDQMYIILEICSNDDLKELVKRRHGLSEFEVKYYTHQIISAVKYMRDHKIIHRDLKPANIFLNNKLQCKIGDFGLALET